MSDFVFEAYQYIVGLDDDFKFLSGLFDICFPSSLLTKLSSVIHLTKTLSDSNVPECFLKTHYLVSNENFEE